MYNNKSNHNVGGGGGGMSSASHRWSMSSNLRHSINSQTRSSLLNSSMMMPQRPDIENGALSSSVMGPPSNRQSNYAFRQSINGGASGGGGGGSSSSGAGIGGGPISTMSSSTMMMGGGGRDPRPVKDKTFQRNTILNLVNFLTQAGYPNAVSTRTFTQPSNKDFQDVFKFLYNKLEPGFEFQKRFEEEVPILLKTMRYPAADTISRTTLYAVGTPHSWPNMLALLGWMMDLINIIAKFDKMLEFIEFGGEDMPSDQDIDPQLDLRRVYTQRVLYNYLTRSYRHWMLTGEEDQETEAMLQLSFQRMRESNQAEIRKIVESNESLHQTLEAARNNVSPLLALEQEQQRLRTDVEKFKAAIEHMRPRIEEMRNDNESGTQQIANLKSLAVQLQMAVKETQEVIKSQTTTREGLEAKLEERNTLRRREAGLKQQVAELENQHRELEKRFGDGEVEAERVAKEYNTLAATIGVVPSTSKYARGEDYELRLHLENTSLTGNSSTGIGITNAPLYSVDIKGKVEPKVSTLRNQLIKEANQTNIELAALTEEIEILEDVIVDDDSDFRSKENQYALLNKKYQEEKESSRNEIASRQAFAESQAERAQEYNVESSQIKAECDRLDQEDAHWERQAALNKEIFSHQIKELLQQLVEVKQFVEQNVGLMSTMAAKELADTIQEQTRLHDLMIAQQAYEDQQYQLQQLEEQQQFEVDGDDKDMERRNIPKVVERDFLFS